MNHETTQTIDRPLMIQDPIGISVNNNERNLIKLKKTKKNVHFIHSSKHSVASINNFFFDSNSTITYIYTKIPT